MGDLMLLGVLRMPPEAWGNDEFDKRLRHARYLQAADEIENSRRTAQHWKAEHLAGNDVIDRLRAELDAIAAALPGTLYMDPPDGGDVPLHEQVRRMALDAARLHSALYGLMANSCRADWPEDLYSAAEAALQYNAALTGAGPATQEKQDGISPASS